MLELFSVLIKNKMVVLNIHFSNMVLCLVCHGLILLAIQITASYGDTTHIQVMETDREGTILMNETGNAICNVTAYQPSQSEQYVQFVDRISMVTLKPLDLEVLKLKPNSTTLVVQYMCGGDRKNISIDIIPVNEFPPIFINAPFYASVKEESAKGVEVIYLGNKWSDNDQVKYNSVSAFRIHSYLIPAFDGKDYFEIDNITGNITTTIVFDYESLSRRYFMLNISIEDDGGSNSKTTYSSVNVTILDTDDNPPVFISCRYIQRSTCHVTAYSATVDRYFQGTLPVSPAPIYAEDRDVGINAQIQYNLESMDEMAENIKVNNHTGEVEVIEPFNNRTNWTDTEILNISIQVMATERSMNSRQTNITLSVYIYREFPTTTSTTSAISSISASTAASKSTVQSTEKSSSGPDTLLLVEIIVPTCGVIVIVIIVVCIVLKRRKKQRDTRYKLGKNQRDENARKSENYERKNIDVISSTPINPYELINMYARMDSGHRNGDSPSSSKTENSDAFNNGTRHAEENEKDKTEVELEDHLYANVDVRKQRKRQKQALGFMNHAADMNGEINVDDSDGFDTGTNANNTSDVGESPDTFHTETSSNDEHQSKEMEHIDADDFVNDYMNAMDTSQRESDKDYDNVELY